MRSAEELKRIFQDGWNIPTRVDNYVRNVAEAEFTEGECCEAWCAALDAALEVPSGLHILDAGTGPGVFACLYARMGHHCIGLDFSNRMLAEARRRAEQLKATCTFVFGDAEEPPFDDAQFDVVSSRHLLFNLPRPGVALHHWVRVLKPGGRMILIGDVPEDLSRPAFGRRIRRVFAQYRNRFFRGRRPSWNPEPGYLDAVSECPLFRSSTPVMLRVLMEAAGLQDICSHPTDAIHAARFAKRTSRNGRRSSPARPFILAGVKPR